MKKIMCLLFILTIFSFPKVVLGQEVSKTDQAIRRELYKYKLYTEIEVELNSNIFVKGKLVSINKTDFLVFDSKNNIISYSFSDTKQVKKVKHNLFLSTIHTLGQTVTFIPTLGFYFLYCSTHNCS